jgi:hypothetical protein
MRYLSDEPVVKSFMSGLRVGDPRAFGGLTILPLLETDAVDLAWLLLDEAIAAGTLEIKELGEAGTVGALLAINTGAQAVLLLDGEELAGAKQNRVLNTTVLVGAGQKVQIVGVPDAAVRLERPVALCLGPAREERPGA